MGLTLMKTGAGVLPQRSWLSMEVETERAISNVVDAIIYLLFIFFFFSSIELLMIVRRRRYFLQIIYSQPFLTRTFSQRVLT